MTFRMLGTMALGVLGLALVLGGSAEARNEHCAGGIQYVVQAMKDKTANNIDDYQREINKAVQQLVECSSADPNDFEAIGYLGWAYAEIESAGPAGQAFDKAISGLKSKGDVKKADWVSQNRESYWVANFNAGIAKISAAQSIYPDFTKQPASDDEKRLKDEAAKNYNQAIAKLNQALMLKPGEPRTLRNLGSVYAFMGDFKTAELEFREGLKSAPNDSALAASLHSVRTNSANQMIDQKKYDDAIAYYGDLAKTDPNNSDLYLGIADAHFKRAQEAKGDAAKADFKAAGEAYAKAASLKPKDADLPFNSALSYQNAGDWAAAETQWKATLAIRPADADAQSALGQTLSEQSKFAEALKILQAGVLANPKIKTLHRQLGSVYTKMQNNAKSTEELMVYLALNNGKPIANPADSAKAAPAGSAAAKTFASMGPPEDVVRWSVDQQSIESWFYWKKNQAFHFQKGQLYGKSDWGTVATSVPAGKK